MQRYLVVLALSGATALLGSRAEAIVATGPGYLKATSPSVQDIVQDIRSGGESEHRYRYRGRPSYTYGYHWRRSSYEARHGY